MIQIRTIRYGNWVLKQSEKLRGDLSVPFQLRVITPQETHKYAPIILTEAHLIMAGFRKTDPQGFFPYWTKKYTRVLVETDFRLTSDGQEYGDFRWIEGNANVPLNYLHQLQNLWYLITGDELDFKL